MFWRSIVLVTLLCVGLPQSTQAAIIVSLDNAALNAGDSATIDVLVTGASGNVDLLDFFVATFRITALGGALEGGVTFDDPPVNPFDQESGYVFYNNSMGLLRTVTPFLNPSDSLTVIDGTSNFLGVDVNSGDFLLAKLEFSVNSGLVGISQYQIALIGDESQFQNEVTVDIALSSSGGLLTVTGSPAAVPEPASSAVAGAMVLVGWCVRKRRHRRTQSRSCEAVGVPE